MNRTHITQRRLQPVLQRPVFQRYRRGLTLIEVLMSIFVLAIGLFGVAAMLPLGQRKMIEGAIDSKKPQVAESAIAYLSTQGGLNPSRWITPTGATTGTPFDVVRVAPAARILCQVTGSPDDRSFATNATGLSAVDGTYSDCVVEFRGGRLRGQRRLISNYTGSTKTFLLDPAGTLSEPLPVAPYVGDTLSNDANSNGRYDVGDDYVDGNANGVYDPPDTFVVIRSRAFAIDPYLVAKLGTSAGDFALGMPRVTLSAPAGTATPMVLAAAEYLTTSDDDLLFNRPVGNNDPTQIYSSEPYIDVNGNGVYDLGVDTFTASVHDMNGNGTWDGNLKRKSELNMSWAATLVPTIAGNTEQYRVSIVVFYKRVLDAVGTAGGPTAMEVKFNSSGLGGGAAFLRATSSSSTQQADIAPVRAGHWVLVSNTSGKEHRWYRISAIGVAFQDSANGNRWTRDVSLAGADWNGTADQTSNAVYYPGVVGVFERTLQIETLPDTSN